MRRRRLLGQTGAIRQAALQAQDMTCKRTLYKSRVDELHGQRTGTSRIMCAGATLDSTGCATGRSPRTIIASALASQSQTCTSTANACQNPRRPEPELAG